MVTSINKKCPIAMDSVTRLDSASQKDGFLLKYFFTITSITNRDVDINKFKATMEKQICEKNATDTTAAMVLLRKNKVSILYNYNDKVGWFLATFVCENN